MAQAATKNAAKPDDVLIRLGQFAHRVPAPVLPDLGSESRFGQRRSRFWFKLQTLEEETRIRKEQIKKPQLEHLDADIQARLDTFKDELPPKLQANLERVREFFLRDISPLTLAISAGAKQGREVIERLTGSEVDPSTISKFQQMMGRASTFKMAQFVLSYFDLGPEFLNQIVYSQRQEDGMAQLTEMVKQLIEQQNRLGPNTPEGTK